MTYTVNCSILLTELPLLERPAAARAAGFESVEFWWPFTGSVPSDSEIDAFVSAIRDAGVSLTGLNFNAGDMPAGERGLVSSPLRTGEFRDNIDVVAGIGKQLGCTGFNALYGLRDSAFTPEEQDEVAAQNLALAAQAIAEINGTVLLEPVSGADAYPLKTASDVMSVIERVRTQSGVTNLLLLADFYHLAVNGDDVDAAVEAYAADIGHIQIADAPGRGEPGTGDLPLARWIERSRQLGYDGPISLEYKATRQDPFAWLLAERRA